MAVETTQDAILEKFLADQRAKQILPFIRDKNVLDFGCGREAWSANAVAKYCHNIEGIEKNYVSTQRVGNVTVYPNIDHLPPGRKFDVIIALAVFEHINPFSLLEIMKSLSQISSDDALIIGTVPTPQARPILEFIAYRLRLIDSSQIRDHKVYYDELWLSAILEKSEWELVSYNTFQLGLNSRFVLRLK
jgi:2-polyprenyl-3-methyl-5-hydroxy-6-metoxy-1,4-benzoquinol methylase